MSTLIDILNKNAGDFCYKQVLRYRNYQLEYALFLDSSDKFAQGLRNLEYRPKDLVVLFMPNIPEFVTAYYGVLKARCRALPLNASLRKNELKYIFNLPEVRGIIYWDRFEKKIALILEQLEDKPKLIRVGDTGELQCQSFDQIIRESTPISTDEYPSEEDEAVILYSSGRTKNPKGAVLTHKSILISAKIIAETFEFTSRSKIIGVLPLYHYLGHTVIMNAALISGAEIILHTRFKPEEILNSISRTRATVMVGIPMMYDELAETPPNNNYDLTSLKYCIVSGGFVKKDTAKKFEELFNIKLSQAYGSVETTSVVTCDMENGNVESNIGKPLKGVEVKIIDKTGNILFPGETGELAVKSPTNMKYYYNPYSNENRNAAISDWHLTGDFCKYDDSGNIHMVGLKSEVIQKGLYPVFPEEIEEVLFQNEKVKDASVVGIPDKDHFQEIKAYVVKNPDVDLNKDEISAFCRERLPKYKCPKQIEIVDYLPKNASGMVIKRFLK